MTTSSPMGESLWGFENDVIGIVKWSKNPMTLCNNHLNNVPVNLMCNWRTGRTRAKLSITMVPRRMPLRLSYVQHVKSVPLKLVFYGDSLLYRNRKYRESCRQTGDNGTLMPCTRGMVSVKGTVDANTCDTAVENHIKGHFGINWAASIVPKRYLAGRACLRCVDMVTDAEGW